MHEDYCGGKDNPGLCEELDPYDGELLRSYMLDVRFRGESGIYFYFIPSWLFQIINIQRHDTTQYYIFHIM